MGADILHSISFACEGNFYYQDFADADQRCSSQQAFLPQERVCFLLPSAKEINHEKQNNIGHAWAIEGSNI